MTALKTFLASHTPKVTQAITDFFAERKKLAARYSSYLTHSVEVTEEFTLRGGKQIRPMLTLLAAQIAGQELTLPVYQVAAAVELFHKHILNIDDIADRDEMRYGSPTIWKAYQREFSEWKNADHHARSFSEIDGTLLGSFAFEVVRTADVSAEQRLAVMEVFSNQMYLETFAGWQIHYYQNQQSLADANEAEFLKGLDLVTSRYTFVGPLRIGLILANQANTPLAKTLEQYGLATGLAYQLTDDILGLFGDPSETGKAVGNDVREGKKTLLLQRAYQAASPEDKQFLVEVCGREISEQELAKVQEIVKKTGALDASQKLAEENIATAVKLLEELSLSGENVQQAKDVLIELAHFVGQRKK
jgi:geranylgeranyl diphosphate synthase, type I